MNELERMIAALSRPEPSSELDERVKAVLAQPSPGHSRPKWRSVLASCGTSACIGLIGFYLGRQSIGPARESATIASTVPAPAPASESVPVSTNVTKIPLREDQLAGLFANVRVREGMLGKGPVTIEISTSHGTKLEGPVTATGGLN